MTRRDTIIKWIAYGAALAVITIFNYYVLGPLPISLPRLLPMAAVAVGTLENPKFGAGFGLASGLLMATIGHDTLLCIPILSAAGCLCIEKMEAMTCVCSVGLDMIAIPGDTSANTIAGIIADEAAIGMVNNKTTAVRLIPAPGKKAGDTVNFGGLFGYAPVMPVNEYKNDAFIERGGRIPAPLHSLRN